MLPTIYLDDQAYFPANEIDRTRSDRLLPYEFESAETS
jgi:hypothetical protein